MTNWIFYKTEYQLPERTRGYSSSEVVLGWYEHSQSWIFCFYDFSGDVWITHDDRGEILSKDQIKFWTDQPESPYAQ